MSESTVYRSILAGGEERKQREIAINLLLLRRGVTIDIIASSIGLSVEEVQQLQLQLNQSAQS
ncbi:hypothetical protein BCD64_27370 [Nostoc sp. MBR 210]|nr:hypothetical protein BCD64_27370 [Nostoc sp. MBR 210]